MAKFSTIFSATGEDFIDELVSSVVYKETQKVSNGVREDMEKTGNEHLDSAIEGALQTLTFSFMNTAIVVVSEYAMVKSVAILGGLITFIKTRGMFFKAKGTFTKIFNQFGKRGKMAGKAINRVTSVLMGTQEQTLAIAKMTNDTSNNLFSVLSQERQNQIMINNKKIDRIDSEKSRMYNIRNSSRGSQIGIYQDKFRRGAWKKTNKDKKLYEDITGQKVTSWNLDFVSNLNNYKEFAISAEGKIISASQANIDLITSLG